MNQRQATIDHARTVLAIVEGDLCKWEMRVPHDVHLVALAFASAICDNHPELASGLAAAVRDTARFNPTDLTHRLLDQLDIIEDSPGGMTLTYAFTTWAFCEFTWADKTSVCVSAVRSAAEAVCVWARETGAVLSHPACPNNPITVLAGARERLTEPKEAQV